MKLYNFYLCYIWKGDGIKLSRIPTGIDSLDPVLQGGLPSGSFILLIGEIGAGDFEFAITTTARLLMASSGQNSSRAVPEKICYISLTRSTEDVLKEIAFSFPDYYNIIQNSISKNRMEIKDFSEAYFARSFIPATWRSTSRTELSFESLRWNPEEKNLVDTLIDYLDKNANGKIVILDSMTSLARYSLENMQWGDLILFLRGLQKASKKWDGLVYAILCEGIFDKSKQEEISDCTDGVMIFQWETLNTSQRKRVMYLKKFRGVLPGLDQDSFVNFETQITQQKGFEISNIKRVRSR